MPCTLESSFVADLGADDSLCLSCTELEPEDGLALQGVVIPSMNSLENKEPSFLQQIVPLSHSRVV